MSLTSKDVVVKINGKPVRSLVFLLRRDTEGRKFECTVLSNPNDFEVKNKIEATVEDQVVFSGQIVAIKTIAEVSDFVRNEIEAR